MACRCLLTYSFRLNRSPSFHFVDSLRGLQRHERRLSAARIHFAPVFTQAVLLHAFMYGTRDAYQRHPAAPRPHHTALVHSCIPVPRQLTTRPPITQAGLNPAYSWSVRPPNPEPGRASASPGDARLSSTLNSRITPQQNPKTCKLM